MKTIHLEKFFKDLILWVRSDISPSHKGVRDLAGNIIDSPNKIIWLNSTDVKNCTDLQQLLKTAKKTSDLTSIGERKANNLSDRYIDPITKKVYNVPLSKFTTEPLPKHFADAQDRIVLIWGDPSSGKTLLTSTLIVKMQNIFNFTSKNRTLLCSADASQFDFFQKGYHYHLDNAAVANGKLPRPTALGESLQQFPLYFESTFDGIVHKAIIKLVDLPGEYQSGAVEDSLPHQADCLWFCIDGVDFFTNPFKTQKTVEKLSNLLEVFPILRKVPIYIILTKGDQMKEILFKKTTQVAEKSLFEENFQFKGLFPNNSILNSACTKSVHIPEFDIDAQKSNSRFTSALMEALYPAAHLQLSRYCTQYITVSSLSSNPINGKISKENLPFALDELLFLTLRNFNLY